MKYIIAPLLLLAALAPGQTWIVEQVDSTAAAESPVELVKSTDGRLWASYQVDSGVVRVACLRDSGWSLTDVCSATAGGNFFRRPYLAAGPHGELCLSCYSPDSEWLYRLVRDTWQYEPDSFINANHSGALAYDTAGRLYIAYNTWAAEFWVGHETDSGWTSGFVVALPHYGWFNVDIGYLTTAADGSPWFFGYGYWYDGPYHAGDGIALMHLVGDTWTSVWERYGGGGGPIPVGLAPHDSGVGTLTDYNGFIQCDSEPITSISEIPVAGLAYSDEDVPLVAWVPLQSSGAPVFGFKTNRWHTESIPGPAGIGGLDIETDTNGQVVIVYSTEDSGLWCAKGTDVVGAKESLEPQAASREPASTIARRVLFLAEASGLKPQVASLLDAAGRKVLSLHSGANDVRALAPGVYFVRESQAQARGRAVSKVVVTR